MAAIAGKGEIVANLLENGASTKVTNALGKTPLLNALEASSTEVAEVLLKSGVANLDARDGSTGATALHLCATLGLSSAAKTILSTGHADINARDVFGQTPLHRAAQADRPDIGSLLLSARADRAALTCTGDHFLDLAIAWNSQRFLLKPGQVQGHQEAKVEPVPGERSVGRGQG